MENIEAKWGPVRDWLVYQDEFLLAVNKPSGLRTIPDGYDNNLPHLVSALNGQFGRLWIVHRLDKETSGILLLARSVEVHRHLNQQFDRREIAKTYHAIVAGSPPWQRKSIDSPLQVDGDRKHRTVVNSQRGKAAVSDVELLARFQQATLVAVHPKSGYTHQIRVHLASVGFPILFDSLYRRPSHPAFPDIPGRLALHALRITFTHPYTGKPAQLEAPIPTDLKEMLNALSS
jgi:tRNA pseudouridine32 synthase / 23S rRNA pseudouridine746 synthase